MRRFCSWTTAVAVSGLLAAPAIILASSPAVKGQAQAQNKTPTRRNGFVAPYPGSTRPDEVLANIRAVVEQTSLAQALEVEDLRRPDIRIRRLLEVRSDNPAPGYLVVELDTAARSPLALIAITTAGEIMGAQDIRGLEMPKPLELAEVAERVSRRRGKRPLRTEYVYFHNVAEPGLSYFRPLAVVITEKGSLYFNSMGEVFADDNSPLVSELGPSGPARPTPPGMKKLRPLGKW